MADGSRPSDAAALRAVAVFEACKGALVLATGLGLMALMHRDVYELAVRLIEHMHLNPASRFPTIFLDAAARVDDASLRLIALGAAAYAVIRLAEAWGLWQGKAWAEWLAALSGAIYLPVEVRELLHRPGALTLALLVINLLVVALMVRALWHRRKAGPG